MSGGSVKPSDRICLIMTMRPVTIKTGMGFTSGKGLMIIKELGRDFDINKIAGSGQAFRFFPLGTGKYLLAAGQRSLKIEALAGGKTCFFSSEKDFEKIWAPYFDLDTDYSVIAEKIQEKADPYLLAALKKGRGIRILRQDPWESLVTFILSQRKNIPAIKKAVEALCKAAGKKIPVFENARKEPSEERPKEGGSDGSYCLRDLYAFPGPEDLFAFSEKDWAGCRFGYREKYLRRLVRDAASGKLDLQNWARLSDPDLEEKLLALYGVGKKVAACVMLYGFHRLNAFPQDVWIHRILEDHYGGKADLNKYAPYSGLVQQYLFEYGRKEDPERRN